MNIKCPNCEAELKLPYEEACDIRCDKCGALSRVEYEPVITLVDANPPPVEPPKESSLSKILDASTIMRYVSRVSASPSMFERLMKPAKPLKKDDQGRNTYDIFNDPNPE